MGKPEYEEPTEPADEDQELSDEPIGVENF
jgi:hypothetical protein